MSLSALPSFSVRTQGEEWMDDLAVAGKPLTAALDELRVVNRYLGGYAATLSALGPWLKSRAGTKTRMLDVGTGVGDFPEMIVRWAARQKPAIDVQITAIDANPATVAFARESLQRRLPGELAQKITVECADAMDLPYPDQSFDVAMAAMFLHHFPGSSAVDVVKSMRRVARHGVLINDLHRYPLAYFGIKTLTHILPASPMVRHDGPLSVLRGFKRDELAEIGREAGLTGFDVRWHWAFRWVLSSVGNP
jgi:SAM-dependent methyltransferase